MKTKLDAAVVAAAECPPGKRRLDIYCSVITGLVLEVRPSGGKTYYARFTNQFGKQQQVKLGAADRITFDQARKAARKVLAEAALGHDPTAAKAERKAVPLFATLADDAVAHALTHMRSIKTFEGYMRRVKARWGKTRLTDIKQQDVALWLAELRASGLAPATVEKTRVIMNRAFELGAQWGVAGADRNPVKGIPRPRFSNARETYIDAEQASRLIEAAKRSRNPQLGSVVQLLLLTGMRVSELLSMRWKNVDLTARTMFVERSKNGRSRRIPMSQAAIDVVTAMPRPRDAVYLFPNQKDPLKHLTTIKHGWQTARKLCNLSELRLHDLRHSFASAAAQSGVDLYHIGQILGHAAHSTTTARYSHLANDTLLAAVEAGAARLGADRPATP